MTLPRLAEAQGVRVRRWKDKLEVVPLPPPEEVAGYQTKNQTAKVSLPGYIWEKGEYEKNSNNCHPKGERDRYGEYKHSQPWSHHR